MNKEHYEEDKANLRDKIIAFRNIIERCEEQEAGLIHDFISQYSLYKVGDKVSVLKGIETCSGIIKSIDLDDNIDIVYNVKLKGYCDTVLFVCKESLKGVPLEVFNIVDKDD